MSSSWSSSRRAACAGFSGGSEGADLAAGRPDARRPADPRAARTRTRPADPLRVTVARDPARIIAWLGIRLVIAEVGLVVGLQTPGAIGIAVTLAGVTVLGYVVLLTLHVLSLRLEIRPGEVRVVSLLVRRPYPIQPGPVTRMRVEPRKGIFGTQLGGFGIEIGLGRAPTGDASGESVHVVRLAPVSTLIVIPSSPTRLAVVPSSEPKLLRALERAAEGTGFDAHRVGGQGVASRASR
jgi:hypothetical protein